MQPLARRGLESNLWALIEIFVDVFAELVEPL